jgi:hypothetical protein
MRGDLEQRQFVARRGLRALTNIIGDLPRASSVGVEDLSALLSMMADVIEDAIPDRDARFGVPCNDREEDG